MTGLFDANFSSHSNSTATVVSCCNTRYDVFIEAGMFNIYIAAIVMPFIEPLSYEL